jgi:hypothetical protein
MIPRKPVVILCVGNGKWNSGSGEWLLDLPSTISHSFVFLYLMELGYDIYVLMNKFIINSNNN